MKKYSKKIALILALSLTLALAIPALAQDTVINGSYQATEIKVSVPTNATAIINPYALPVTINDDNGAPISKEVENSQIVVTQPILGYNWGKIPLSVGASVLGTPKGDFRLALEKPSSDTTTKTGLVFFEIKTGVDLGYATTPDTVPLGAFAGEKVVDALNAWTTPAYKSSAKDQILVGTRAASKSEMVTLKGVDTTTGEPVQDSCFIARLNGTIVKAPKEAWVAADGLEVTITWTFEPSTPTTTTP